MRSVFTCAFLLLSIFAVPALGQYVNTGYGSPSLLPIPQRSTGYLGNATPASYQTPEGVEQGLQLNSLSEENAIGSGVSYGTATINSYAPNNDAPAGENSYQDAMSAPYHSSTDRYSTWGNNCHLSGLWNNFCRSRCSHGQNRDTCDACNSETVYLADCNSCSPWFGGVYGMMMSRDDDEPVWLSFNTASVTTPLLGSSDAEMDWQAGLETRFGRMIGDQGHAVEFVYWRIFSDTQEANAFDPAPPVGTTPNMNTTLDLTTLDYDNGMITASVNDWYDGAQRHRLRRSYEFHNLEMNLIRHSLNSGLSDFDCGPRFRFDWAFGLRYLRINEGFQYATADTSTVFGVTPADELFYDIDIENDLFGGQFGCRADYNVSNKWSIFAETKLGIYQNYISHRSRIGGSNGAAIVGGVFDAATNPNAGRAFDIRSSKKDVSFVGETRIGTSYQFSPRLRGTIGYRAVSLTGVALPTDQIPTSFADIDGVADIDSTGSMILHGGYAGIELSY